MGLNIDFINIETLLTLGIIFLALGIILIIISIIINKKLSKKQPKTKPKNAKISTNEIKNQDLPFIEQQEPKEEINVVRGTEIPKIIIDRNNPKQNPKENIQPVEITLEQQEQIKITTDIIEIDQPQENEIQEEISNNLEEFEEITLKELEEELPVQEKPKQQLDFIELDQSQKEIKKTEPTIIKPKEITITTTKPIKGKEQKINLEESEEEIELL